ncbi:hypothetical protein, partial [Escherichia coli]|uniref:hypothetical protein n=1 Tax=Escherichia coli TaxID=562 RepID=UPI002019B85D
QDTCLYSRHTVGTPNILVRAAPRHPANASRHAKNAYRGFQEVRRADTPNQGLSGRQEPRQPPAKPICTALAAIQLVGGRRPSMLQRWGSGVLPRRFPVALKALPEPWQLRRFGDYRAKVANDVNDVILRRLPYPASHRTDMRQKSNAG